MLQVSENRRRPGIEGVCAVLPLTRVAVEGSLAFSIVWRQTKNRVAIVVKTPFQQR
jgi:hypothetical protein